MKCANQYNTNCTEYKYYCVTKATYSNDFIKRANSKVVSISPEDPTTSHLGRSSWLSPVFKRMQRWFPNSKLPLIVSHAASSFKLIEISLNVINLQVIQIIFFYSKYYRPKISTRKSIFTCLCLEFLFLAT